MLRFWKTLLLCLALAGLPLQGLAAVTMSGCKHGAADAAAQPRADHAHHGDDMAAGLPAADTAQPCDDCTPCQLCSAFALPAAAPALLPGATPHYPAFFAPRPDGHFPDQPKRPPLA